MALSTLAGASLAVACCGCQTTQEKSAELERQAKHEALALRGVSVTRESPSVRVVQSAVIHSRAATAVVVTLRDTSSRALENAPIEITVRDAKGDALFKNDQPGEAASLTSVSLLEPGAKTTWVDDQVQVAGPPAPAPVSASALVGEATPVSGAVPRISLSNVRPGNEADATGAVTNRSGVTQQNLVVDAIARRGEQIVAAGRAILPEVTPGASLPFQIYFVGDPRGAQIEAGAPASTF